VSGLEELAHDGGDAIGLIDRSLIPDPRQVHPTAVGQHGCHCVERASEKRRGSSLRRLDNRLPARIAELEQTLPTGHITRPNDIAALILQVMLNPAITGAEIPLDSGQILA
jgi:hypothetical protein